MDDNAYHIFHVTNVDTTAVLDGFVVEKGNANSTGNHRYGSAFWIEHSLRDKKLADNISSFDPYTSTLEDLRRKIIRMIEIRIPQ